MSICYRVAKFQESWKCFPGNLKKTNKPQVHLGWGNNILRALQELIIQQRIDHDYSRSILLINRSVLIFSLQAWTTHDKSKCLYLWLYMTASLNHPQFPVDSHWAITSQTGHLLHEYWMPCTSLTHLVAILLHHSGALIIFSIGLLRSPWTFLKPDEILFGCEELQ